MRRVVFIIPIVFFGILAIINLGGARNGCYTMANGILGLISAFIAIVYTIILSLISLYWRIRKKIKFNIFPILTLALIFAIYLLIQNNERASPTILNASINSTNVGQTFKGISITLYENNRFSLKRTGPEYGCIESGKYIINNDTIILKRGKKQHVKGFNYSHFIINRDAKIIMTLNENIEIDSTVYFNIE